MSFYAEDVRTRTRTQGGGCVKTRAEMGAMLLQAQEPKVISDQQRPGRGLEQLVPQPRGTQPCRCCDLTSSLQNLEAITLFLRSPPGVFCYSSPS